MPTPLTITMTHKSALIIISDIAAIKSYTPLIERAAKELAEDAVLDILLLPKITHLNILDLVLAQTYTLSTEILQACGKPQINVSVLFNDHYKELKEPGWTLLIIDTSDDIYDHFDHPERDVLETINIQRSASETNTSINRDQDESSESVHDVAAVGGTFDHFHDGHKILLSASAFLTKRTLIVGVTDEELLKNKKYSEFLQSYDYRVHVASSFLARIKPTLKVDAVPIKDICGPTAVIEDIDGLVVSRETVKGAEFINKTRLERDMHELRVHVINVIGGEADDGFQNKLSSTKLREEEFEMSQKSGQ